MKDEKFYLSRIDRSVADNLRDIDKSFEEDAGIVKDFIVFITKKLKVNMFGYTKFTLNEFCKESGRPKPELCSIHPKFRDNPKAVPPEYFGHKFETTFDYALFNMLQKNIIFSKAYDWNSNSRTIQLKNFSIIKDIRLNVDRQSNAVKVYDVRVSDELLEGFLQRYYTVETSGYKSVGKGRGGDGRKSLFIFLYKTRHILITQQQFKTKLPVSYLCDIAGIDTEKPGHRKQSLNRVLSYIKTNGKLPFKFDFVSDDARTSKWSYWVEIDFFEETKDESLVESHGANKFFSKLITELKVIYKHYHSDKFIEEEKDMFQRWLNSNEFDLEYKAGALVKAYFSSYDINLPIAKARLMVRNGIFSESGDPNLDLR